MPYVAVNCSKQDIRTKSSSNQPLCNQNSQVRPVERMESKAQAVECGRQVRTVPTAPSSLIAAAFCPDQEVGETGIEYSC